MEEQDKLIPHEKFVREVIRNEISQEAIVCEVLDFDPQGLSWQGGIYAPSDITSGSMTLEVTGPDGATYEVILQAADILNYSNAMSAFDLALPESDLIRIWPANPATPLDGQLVLMASGDWQDKAGISIEATSLTLDVGILDDTAGAYTSYDGNDNYEADPGSFAKHDGNLFYRLEDRWVSLTNGFSINDFYGVLNFSAGDDTPRRQSISMIPEFRSISFDARDESIGTQITVYLTASSDSGGAIQYSCNGDAGQASGSVSAGTVDPSAGDGLSQGGGTLYTRDVGDGTMELWFKQGPDDTDWTRIVPPAV